MSWITDLIRPELSNIAIFDFVYTLAYANIDQSVPNLSTKYMPIRSQMSSIMGQIETEYPELFAFEFGKIAESDCLHSSIYKYLPNNMYVTIRSQMSSIIGLIGPEMSE